MTDFVFTRANGRIWGHIDHLCDPKRTPSLSTELLRIELSEDKATLPIEKLLRRFGERV